jgi:hypothetical protein
MKQACKQSLAVKVLAEDALLFLRSISFFQTVPLPFRLGDFWISCPIVTRQFGLDLFPVLRLGDPQLESNNACQMI